MCSVVVGCLVVILMIRVLVTGPCSESVCLPIVQVDIHKYSRFLFLVLLVCVLSCARAWVCSSVQFVCDFCLVNRVLVHVRMSPCDRVVLLCCG